MSKRTTYNTMITHASLETLERRHIARVLRAKHGNLTMAAEVLGIDRRTLYRKIEKYDIKRRNYKGQRRPWNTDEVTTH